MWTIYTGVNPNSSVISVLGSTYPIIWTYGLMSHPKDKVIMVKYLDQRHEWHDRDSNPHSADQKHQSLSLVLLTSTSPKWTPKRVTSVRVQSTTLTQFHSECHKKTCWYQSLITSKPELASHFAWVCRLINTRGPCKRLGWKVHLIFINIVHGLRPNQLPG